MIRMTALPAMPHIAYQLVRAARRPRAVCAVILCLTAMGCSSPLRPGLAKFQENREIDKLVNDKSFPMAAEVGLATAKKSTDDDG